MCATARPWLPSVAATSVTPACVVVASSCSAANVGGGSSWPARAPSARQTAHDAPRILNDGSPKRSTSIFIVSRARPSCAATRGSSSSGLGA